MPKLSPKAIILGAIVDVGTSTVLGIPLAIYILSHIGISTRVGSPAGDAGAVVVAVIHSNPLLWGIQLLIGGGCSILGGYVAARLAAGRDELQNAILASWLCVGMGIYTLVSGRSQGSLWLHLLLIASTPIFYALGAVVLKRSSHTTGVKR